MKKIKLFLVTASFALFATIVHAQEKTIPPASERAAKQTAWMKTNLQLSAEQEAKVQAINLKYAGKLDEVKAASGSKKSKMMAAKKEQEAKDAELKAVLDEKQYSTYLAKKTELKEKYKEQRKEAKQG